MIESKPRESTTEEVVAELRKRSAFVFVSHVKPDGDTLGAGLALGIALRNMGKRVHYFQQDPVPRNLRFLPDADRVSREIPSDLPKDALWVFCDMSDTGRAGEFLPKLERENVLDIDHHLGNTMFGALNYVLSDECSTGTCVLKLLKAMNAPITPEIATNDGHGRLHPLQHDGRCVTRFRRIDGPRREQGRRYGADLCEQTLRGYAPRRRGNGRRSFRRRRQVLLVRRR
jgi:hypothetical protein